MTTYVISTSSANFLIYDEIKLIGEVKRSKTGYISHWTGDRFKGLQIEFSTAKRAIDAMIKSGNKVVFKNESVNLNK